MSTNGNILHNYSLILKPGYLHRYNLPIWFRFLLFYLYSFVYAYLFLNSGYTDKILNSSSIAKTPSYCSSPMPLLPVPTHWQPLNCPPLLKVFHLQNVRLSGIMCYTSPLRLVFLNRISQRFIQIVNTSSLSLFIAELCYMVYVYIHTVCLTIYLLKNIWEHGSLFLSIINKVATNTYALVFVWTQILFLWNK